MMKNSGKSLSANLSRRSTRPLTGPGVFLPESSSMLNISKNVTLNPLQESILEEIIEERERQRTMVADTGEDKRNSPADWIGKLVIWLGKAAQETPLSRGKGFSKTMYKNRLIQIAAICVAALEVLDDRD